MTFKIHIDTTNHHTPPDKLPYITPTVTFEEIEGGGVMCQTSIGSNVEDGDGNGDDEKELSKRNSIFYIEDTEDTDYTEEW